MIFQGSYRVWKIIGNTDNDIAWYLNQIFSIKLNLSTPSPQTFVYPYRQVSNISRTLVGNEIVDHPDVVGASPVGAATTTTSFST